MNFRSHIQRLLDYDHWANRETLASIRASSAPPAQVVKLMAHILSAEILWISRLRSESSTLVVWPELSLDDMERRLGEIQSLWGGYLEEQSAEGFNADVDYSNSQGEKWTNTATDILLHVVMHSGYHRGQIATRLREAGHAPAYTDFIHAVRQGHLE